MSIAAAGGLLAQQQSARQLQAALRSAWSETMPSAKLQAVHGLWQQLDQAALPALAELPAPALGLQPGRPSQPRLVHPASVPRRRLGSVAGRVALLHAIAHIEFNAINLALDACLRFAGMPAAFYLDWLSVAADEARHFRLLQQRLQDLGAEYGDLPAHDGLWQMAIKTADDVLARMALVPRVLEARGLDVTPGMIDRLRAVGDDDSVAVLQVILEEEVRHVEIGTRWFRHCCARRGLEPDTTFIELLDRLHPDGIKPPINDAARRRAEFSASELHMLHARIARQATG
ncbi:MAG: ferritin-like domain-containing protein [Wenzhouxiangellaceae bacterium]